MPYRRLAIVLVSSAMLTTTAFAQTFDGKDVEGFIGVIEEAESLSEKYPDEREAFQSDFQTGELGTMIGEDGEFRVFSSVTNAMMARGDKAMVRDYEAVVRKNGFDDLADYGTKGDAILMAYMSTQIGSAEMAQLRRVTPEMVSAMPPEMRQQMEGVTRLADALEDVPQEDVETIAPYRKRLEAAFD